MDEPWKYYAKWKKWDTKSYIVCDLFDVYEIFKTGTFKEAEREKWFFRGWRRRGTEYGEHKGPGPLFF